MTNEYRRSQNGWDVVPVGATPENTPSGQPRIRKFYLPNTGVSIWLRDGVAGFILADLAVTFHKSIEKISGPVMDDWGYAYREIRGGGAYSNHASATAEDLNAPKHPLGAVNTFGRIQRFKIRRMLKRRYKGVVRWGGDFNGRKDEMHFEIVGTHAEVRAVALDLFTTDRGRSILAGNPGLSGVIRG